MEGKCDRGSAKRCSQDGGGVSHTFLTSEFTAGPSDRTAYVSRVIAAGARGTDALGPPATPVGAG